MRFELPLAERLGFAFIAVAAVVGSYVQPLDLWGWLLLALSFPLFLLDPGLRTDPRSRRAVWFVLCAHHAVALVWAFQFAALSIDAESFHRLAEKYAGYHRFRPAIDFQFFAQLIGRVFRLAGHTSSTGFSRLLSAELAVFSFAAALFCFIKLVGLVGAVRYRVWCILLFGCLPSVVIYTSIPLREALELALLLTYCYLLFRLVRRPRVLTVAVLFPVVVLFGLLHKGLILYAVFLAALIPVVSIWLVWSRQTGIGVAFFAALLPLSLSAGVLIISIYDLPNSGVVNYFLSGRLVENIAGSRALILQENPRSAFPIDIDFSSWQRFAVTYLGVYACYLFTPFLWGVEGLKDLVASLQSLLRLALIIAMTAGFVRGPRTVDGVVLVGIYFSMTMLWALATTNYGQATRHHVLTDWILVLAGLPYLLGFAARFGPRTMHSGMPR